MQRHQILPQRSTRPGWLIAAVHWLGGCLALLAGALPGAEAAPLEQLRGDSLVVIGALLKAHPDAQVDLLIAGQPATVNLVAVDSDRALVYKQFGKQGKIAFADLTGTQLAGVLVAITDDELPVAAQAHLCAGLLYMLDNKTLESAAQIDQAVRLDPDLRETAQARLKALPKPEPIANASPDVSGIFAQAAQQSGAAAVTGAAGDYAYKPTPQGTNQEGRSLGVIPKLTAPVLFDTPEADAIVSALQIFPKNNAWNEDISKLPVLPNSDAIIASIGKDVNIHIDYSWNYILVPPTQPKVEVKIVQYAGESDPGPYPLPANAPIEGWPVWWNAAGKAETLDHIQRVGEGDRHCLVVDPVNMISYEFYHLRKTDSGWQAGCMATWDLKSNALRKLGWTSADAAGLPTFCGLIRHDELERGMVEHAVRVTVERTRKECIYPATHSAGSSTDPNVPAMGQRIRLKAGVPIDDLPKEARAMALGLKKYGMIVADNGRAWDLCATIDKRHNDPNLKALQRLKGSDFEVVQSTPENGGPRR